MKKKIDHQLLRFLAGGAVFLLTLAFLTPAPAIAHPPQKLLLAYDAGNQTLTVTVTHNRFSAGHYIDKIEISKNGAVIAGQDYKSQPAETFTYTYKVNASQGDTLAVKASCNKFGSVTEKFTVGKGK